MKKLVEIPEIFPVTCHTDHVGPGSTFVAIQGYKQSGVTFIPLALKKGASTIILQKNTELSQDLQEIIEKHGASISFVENTRVALAELSAQAAGNPAQKLRIIGITGTKGKTTTTYLVEHILKEAGFKTARISSGENAIADTTIKYSLTTPPADYIQQFLSQCINHNVEWVIMEVAAHALALERVGTITFDGVIFTNFDREHLELFSDLDEYFETKLQIFRHLKPSAPAYINGQDLWCQKIVDLYPQVKTFGLDDKQFTITALLDTGWEYRLSCTVPVDHKNYKLMCPALLGRFNASNIIASIGITLELGVSMDTIAAALYSFKGIPGRQDRYEMPNGAVAIVDYAHTPASYEAILSLLRLLTHNLIVVFGHGGERDKSKRPLLGAAAAKYADLMILTSDNPRTEDPQTIIDDIRQGIPEEKRTAVLSTIDRASAITTAYKYSKRGSIIAILGKGAEETQYIGTKKVRYSDKATLLSL